MTSKLNGTDFKALIESGGNNLSNHHHHIDSLNVFPVPDGDTGTNMDLTFTSGRQQASEVRSESFDEVAKAFSRGLLMGARGNSGVILSQVFRGFSQSVAGKASVGPADLGKAFQRGCQVAYKAIMRPVEGTILTVVRESADCAEDFAEKNPNASVNEFMDVLVSEAEESLKRTPDLLPVLKEVGVLDSGGAGYVEVLRGFKAALDGNPVEKQEEAAQQEEEKSEPGYRVQLFLRLDRLSRQDPTVPDKLKMRLEHIGDSLVFSEEQGLVKVRINTLMPGQALNVAQRYGSFEKVVVESLAGELSEPIVEEEARPTEYAIIAVASGSGLVEMFRNLGASCVVTGGQTMNPSTESFVSAVEKTKANHVIILPNNGNIILAAQQTKAVLEGRDIRVIETGSIPQGISALIAFDPEASADDNVEAMKEAAAHVVSGSVTYAIKDTKIDGLEIRKHDYMGIMDKSIVCADKSVYKSVKSLIDHMITGHSDEYSVLTIIGGEGVEDSDLELIRHYVSKKYPDYEVETSQGGQPVYSYIIGLD